MPKRQTSVQKRRIPNKGPRGYTDRLIDVREPRERFLIVCEGEKTEPNYFRGFRVPRYVVDVWGIGDNTLSLVEKAIELGRRDEDRYDQIWCVFDRDSFPPERFNAALDLASRQGIEVAYSNQSFELWYVLHFHYVNTGMTRGDYCRKLDDLLGRRYEKNDENMYRDLECRQEDAIRNARTLLEQYCPPNPERDDPSTTVHLLVERLRRFAV